MNLSIENVIHHIHRNLLPYLDRLKYKSQKITFLKIDLPKNKSIIFENVKLTKKKELFELKYAKFVELPEEFSDAK